MLKQISIERIKESNLNSKIKASKRQNIKLRERLNHRIRIIDNSRNLNKVALSNGESIKHGYAKYIVSQVLKNNKINFVTEYVIDNKEIDVFDIDNLIIIEVQAKDLDKKEHSYDNLIQSGVINDIFPIPLNKFTGNLNKDLAIVQERLYG